MSKKKKEDEGRFKEPLQGITTTVTVIVAVVAAAVIAVIIVTKLFRHRLKDKEYLFRFNI